VYHFEIGAVFGWRGRSLPRFFGAPSRASINATISSTDQSRSVTPRVPDFKLRHYQVGRRQANVHDPDRADRNGDGYANHDAFLKKR
jgi:hypothetical protein